MRIFVVLLISLNFFNCKNTSNGILENGVAQKVYQDHLTKIKKSLEGGEIENDNSIDVIANLTKIKCHENTTYGYGNFKVPVTYNIEDWESWFNLNKEKLTIENDTLDVINPIALKKEPIKLFKTYIVDLNKMIDSENFDLDKIDYIMNRIEKLVGEKNIGYSDVYENRIPNDSSFNYLDNWLVKNKDKLKWDSEKQMIVL